MWFWELEVSLGQQQGADDISLAAWGSGAVFLQFSAFRGCISCSPWSLLPSSKPAMAGWASVPSSSVPVYAVFAPDPSGQHGPAFPQVHDPTVPGSRQGSDSSLGPPAVMEEAAPQSTPQTGYSRL